MSDQDERTPEEIEAAVEKAKAEAAKARADAALAGAQAKEAEARVARIEMDEEERRWSHEEREREHARKLAYEDHKARLDFERHQADAERHIREERVRRASDYEARRLPFSSVVNERSVQDAIARLNEWDRLDPACPITLVLTSPGGSVFDGMALFGRIRQLSAAGHHVTTEVIGWGASMASVLLQAGDTRVMAAGSWQMVHKCSSASWGSADQIADDVALLKRLDAQALDIYCERATCSREYIARRWTRKDWWVSAVESKALGLVDEIR